MENINLFRLLLVAISVCLIAGMVYLEKRLIPTDKEFNKSKGIKFFSYLAFSSFFIMCVNAFLYYSYNDRQRMLYDILNNVWGISFSILMITVYLIYRAISKEIEEEIQTLIFVNFSKYIFLSGLISMLIYSAIPMLIK